MTIDWTKEAVTFKTELLKDLTALLKIESVRDMAHKTAEFPVGQGPAEALQLVLEMAKRDGFATKNIDNLAGRIAYGTGDTILGVLAHVDVVPAGDGWLTDPYQPVIQDGAIYARGTSDDKGPLIAAYYALRILKKLGIKPLQQIHFIVGTDEESEWLGVHRYAETQPMPDYGFSPDAEFPIINGEKGIVSFILSEKLTTPTNAPYTLQSFKSGLRDNMVPHAATAIIETHQDAAFEANYQTYLAQEKLTGELTFEAGHYTITLIGQGAHAANPQEGRNGATYLAQFLKDLAFDNNGLTYLSAIGTTLHDDVAGKKAGIAYTDTLMGPLTMSPTIFDFDRDKDLADITVNIRFPQGTDISTLTDQLTATFGQAFGIATKGHQEVPHYVSGEDPLVQTLLQTYTDHTGLPGEEVIVGGGTYGRLMKRGVAFGAQFPGRKDLMHQPNECMRIDDLLNATAIYADALYRLTAKSTL